MKEKFKKLSSPLKKGLTIFFGLCVVITLFDLLLNKHGEHWWNFFGFHSLYGFVSCVILVLAANAMRKTVMRDEDYYD